MLYQLTGQPESTEVQDNLLFSLNAPLLQQSVDHSGDFRSSTPQLLLISSGFCNLSRVNTTGYLFMRALIHFFPKSTLLNLKAN